MDKRDLKQPKSARLARGQPGQAGQVKLKQDRAERDAS